MYGSFSNPLGHAGYPPNPQTATVVNSTVRAATLVEVEAGLLNDVYVSPATMAGTDIAVFAAPPPLGSTTPNTVAATTLTSSGNSSLGTAVTATTVNVGNAANTGALTVNIANGANGANATVNILSGNATTGTQTLNVLAGTHAGIANIGTGAAVHTVNLLASTGKLGTFGTAAVVQQLQGALTNSVTVGGSTGVIADYTDLTVYANDAAAIRNDIYQLSLALSGVITGLRNYGLLG